MQGAVKVKSNEEIQPTSPSIESDQKTSFIQNAESPDILKGKKKLSGNSVAPNNFDLSRNPRWAFEEEELLEFPTQTKDLKVLVVTWNQYGQQPGDVIEALLNTKKTEHHLIAISTQECLRSIAQSMLKDSKDEWVKLIRQHLDDKYEIVKENTLNAMHLIVFAHKKIATSIRAVETAEVRAGFANILGNKGAIGITFEIKGNTFLFLSSHLASGQSQVNKRNTDFLRTVTEMSVSLPRLRANDNPLPVEPNPLEGFDYVFYAGDMNYRLDMDYEDVFDCIKIGDYESLLFNDQLNQEKQKEKSIFTSFSEGEIKFAPTYKLSLTSQEYDLESKRAPAWTDRILYSFKSSKHSAASQQKSYDSNRLVLGSDHRPVFSQFLLPLTLKEDKELVSEITLEGFEPNLKRGCCF